MSSICSLYVALARVCVCYVRLLMLRVGEGNAGCCHMSRAPQELGKYPDHLYQERGICWSGVADHFVRAHVLREQITNTNTVQIQKEHVVCATDELDSALVT